MGRSRLRAGVLTWTADLQPTSSSRVYTVVLTYDGDHRPKVRVLRPALEPNEHGELPHIYRSGDLCLYRPGEWTWGDPLTETIVPWTSEWLVFYELWQVTGTWHGTGGTHTGPIDDLVERRPRGRAQRAATVRRKSARSNRRQ